MSLHYPYTWDTGQYSTDFMNMHALGRAVEKRETVVNLECRGPRQRPADGPFPPVSAIDFGSTSVQATAMAEMPAPDQVTRVFRAATRSPLKSLRKFPWEKTDSEGVASYSSCALGMPWIPADFSLSFREPEKTKADPQGKLL